MNDIDVGAMWPDPSPSGARHSVLASDLVLDGNLLSKGPVEVHGKVRGQLRAPEILIASPGVIDGTLIAHEVSVHGAVMGGISARQVSLSSTAIVHADIVHDRIAVDSGAQIEGRLQRQG